MKERKQEDLKPGEGGHGHSCLPSSSNTAVSGAASTDLFCVGLEGNFRDVEGGHCPIFKELTL